MGGRCLLGVGVALAVSVEPVAAQDAASHGRAIARTVCARCHAVRSTGPSPMHEATPFRTLAGRLPLGDLADVLDEGVKRRQPAMPDFRLDPSDAADLAAQMRTRTR